ncbi:SDR family oxidoreductase [Candidatus Manganitrophus noduliformans]|uniref:SDR family oxidoreductase n=1 Tax=Candidatus Manganitrophus noduliformans TaxID=2606439 RepID=A0A7X6DSX7_9BACT|nr:SDR family oxidoreductase [Candidatus Manganitrophus noduliformans]NKE72453.1 SDR family oxidoreductase [Candidatus Manganitrophus noduliformans]
MESVLIIGCGYVGLPLAKGWIEKGFRVYGTTRRVEKVDLLRREGIEPIVVDLLKPPFRLPQADWVYFLVSGSQEETLPRAMTHTIAALLENRPSRFIYTSSTGLYGDYSNGWVDESSLRRAKHPAGARLIETEDMLFTAVEEAQFPGVIVRLSGIYGPNRIPGRDQVLKRGTLRGRPESYLNLIHLDDLIPLLLATAPLSKTGECYLFSDDHPVRRGDYYAFLAKRLGISDFAPLWNSSDEPAAGRRCRNQKMKEHFQIDLKYPSYREGLGALLPVG